ncbi:MAG: hypothetical protein HWN51_05660 [Desulfobacterales bacterium]|nr:hypothetical protein [Desulfobacterales bacterium]
MDEITIQEAIREAEELLPGMPVPDGEEDPRWQAIIAIGEFIQTHLEEVWSFV